MAELLSTSQIETYRRDGFIVVQQFLTDEETTALKEEYKCLVDGMDPMEEERYLPAIQAKKDPISLIKDDYFITSGDKIRYFFEAKAFDMEGNLKYDKYQRLNKIGHALHFLNPTFKQITFSSKVKAVIKSLNMMDPVIIHSMYINKPPFIGSEVIPHQDATYLYCEPDDKVVGLWIALEDADVDNGCLWFIPGSHKDPVSRRMVRIVESGHIKLEYIGSSPDYTNRTFVPISVRKGDLIVIHGKVIHKSEANLSERPRPIYTFHVMDKDGAYFSDANWIQQTDSFKFPSLFSDI